MRAWKSRILGIAYLIEINVQVPAHNPEIVLVFSTKIDGIESTALALNIIIFRIAGQAVVARDLHELTYNRLNGFDSLIRHSLMVTMSCPCTTTACSNASQ
jgi:hypothetical protein